MQGLTPELRAFCQRSVQEELQTFQREGAVQVIGLGQSSNTPVLNSSFLDSSEAAGLASSSYVAGFANQGSDRLADRS